MDLETETARPDGGRAVAILFVDIDGSTRLYEQHGDEAARRFTSACLASLHVEVGKVGGRVVKSLGDGLLCTFPTADAAFRAAASMNASRREGNITVHAGAHYGPVIEELDDVFGDSVNMAARVAGLAKAGEFLMSEDTVVELSPPFRALTRLIDRTKIKGKQALVGIYTLVQQDDNATVLPGGPATAQSGEVALVLKYGSRRLRVAEANGEVLVGRSPDCHLSVASSYASRNHATIEVSRGRVYLRDQSTNGTYLESDGIPLFVKRERTMLQGEGIISLGRSPDQQPAEELISFSVEGAS